MDNEKGGLTLNEVMAAVMQSEGVTINELMNAIAAANPIQEAA